MESNLATHSRSEGADIGRQDLQALAVACVDLQAVDISEVYNPARFIQRAGVLGLAPGFVADAAVLKKDGTPWNLMEKEDENLLERLQAKEQPWLVVGAPPCTAFSRLLDITRRHRDPELDAKRLEEGRHHLEVAVRAYRRQIANNQYFLHEHPAGCYSWSEECVSELLE